MGWKVLITARTMKVVGQAGLDALRNAGCEVVVPEKAGPLPIAELLPAINGFDAALVSPDQYNATALASPELAQLKIISRWGVGYDSIDVPAATKQGIVVSYTPGLLNETVADYTFAMLFGIARKIHEGAASMDAGGWKQAWGHDVFGKTLGIIGCGRIGQAVARRASGFNMRVIAYDVCRLPDVEKMNVRYVSLDDLLETSDFVTLHAALTPENRGLLGEAQLRKMKKCAYLINAARGAMIDDNALVKALKEGWIAGAALDAFTIEPLQKDHPFRGTPNLVLTPHQASCARETGEVVSATAAQAIIDLMNGRRPQFVVDSTVLDSPQLRAKLR